MKDLFLLFVRISIEASILIGFILILRAILRKVPRAYIYGLWLVALLRLLCPVHIETESRVVPGFSAVTPAIVNDWQEGDLTVGRTIESGGGQVLGPGGMTNTPVSTMPGISYMDILSVLWLTGSGVCAIVYTAQYIRMRKRLRTAILAEDGVWESVMVQSPFVMGLIRPRIYLPSGIKGAERAHILAHERMHIRHLDTPVRVSGLLALCLHWWNPVVWLAIRLMNQDMEMVCDESVLKAADMPAKKAYMNTLLTYSMRQSDLSITPYFGETNTEKRIRHILLYKKPTLIIGGILLLAIIACVIIFFVVPKPDMGDRPDSPAMADMESPSPEPMQEMNEPREQLEMTYSEFLTGYSGYLDELNMFEGAYDALDYDGDGLYDRVFRGLFDVDEDGNALSIGYRVDFGNGDTIEIGPFEDFFTGIELIGYDLTGNGVNEIVYCGSHGGSTFPPEGSEIAVFAKTDTGYEMLFLPRFDDWEIDASPYATGFSIYSKDVTETSATLYSPQYGYEESIGIDQNAYEYCFKETGNEPVGSQAWRVAVDTVEGVPALVLYVNIGSKYYERNLMVHLTWQDGVYKPVNMGLEPLRGE